MKDLLDINIVPYDKNEGCNAIDSLPLAYAYVPYQQFEKPYSKEMALQLGTAFPSLNKPLGVYGNEFYGREGIKI